MTPWSEIALLAFDIDGTLTDGTTWWGGADAGWVQRYSVRDGEAILRLKQRLHVVPVSRNRTDGAAERVAQLGLDGRWVGVVDKLEAMACTKPAFRMLVSPTMLISAARPGR